jgi:hypothetical protein
MVTRKLIRVTSPEAAALLADKETSLSSSAAEEDSATVNKQPPTHLTNGSVNKNGGGKKRAVSSGDLVSGKEKTSKRQRVERFVIDLSDVPPQLPIPKSAGHIKEGSSKYAGVSFDKRNNRWEAKIRIDGKQLYIGNYKNEEEAAVDYARAVCKFKGQDALDKARKRNSSTILIDLSDVPPQLPILKSRQNWEGSSKYTGVTFDKASNKWKAQIIIDGKPRRIGCYLNEEKAAIDYARAVFKYKGQEALDNAREQNSSGSKPAIDLSEAEVDPIIVNASTTNQNGEEKKRALPSGGAMISDREVKKSQRADRFVIDLADVPPQLPIPKSKGHIKEGSSKYSGVSFHKASNKWEAKIRIDGDQHHIGLYENEEEAAADYARAVFKYKGQVELDKARERNSSGMSVDLSDVPPKQPILKSNNSIKEGTSKYTGVYFNKPSNKWRAKITIEGKERHIGCYENEGEAAIDYARALFKYKRQGALDKARKLKESEPGPAINIDLRDVPPQQPIPKFEGRQKEEASKYAGVSFHKPRNKWLARIRIDGDQHHIGLYENEEEAAIDYARAVFKYQGEEALANLREQKSSGSEPAINMDLSDVPPQQPVPKIKGRIKEGASKYTGVYFNKSKSKWEASIKIEGKTRHIGLYENEEEAAVDYARAVFKYKGQEALDKAREQSSSGPEFDLRDVPPQLPILKSKGRIKEGSSKYTGVYFHKASKKWQTAITIEGKSQHIGCYEIEEEAAVDYARAVFKYKGQDALDKATERSKSAPAKDLSDVPPQRPIPKSGSRPAINIDLSDVPPQQPVPKSGGRIKEGASKYTGAYFDKAKNKWKAQIRIEGTSRHIGFYENEEEAAIDYARAVFKYKGQEALDKAREPNKSTPAIDLSDVPPQPPILKSADRERGIF